MTEERIKILFVSDGEAPTGFARVSHGIIENLDQDKYEVHHLAINYRGDPHDNWWKLYPAAIATSAMADLWGYSRFIGLIKGIKPNIIFILNDPWVIQRYLALIIESKGVLPGIERIPVVVYFPVDAREHDPIWFRDYDELVSTCCVYTKFAHDVIMETGTISPTRMRIIPHGVNKELFFPVKSEDKKTGIQIARERVFPLKDKPEFIHSFIVLNANRNQPRKRIDITMRAFAEFAKDKPKNVKLYLHMGTQDAGWNIVTLAHRYGIDDRLAVTSMAHNLPNLPDDKLNDIYNACDIGLNTSMGEGWGLTSWEHAACKKPQIVPEHSVSHEIWGDTALYVPTIADFVYETTLTAARIPSMDGVIEKLEWAYQDWKDGGKQLKELGEKAYKLVNRPEYEWKAISAQFDEIFTNVAIETVEMFNVN